MVDNLNVALLAELIQASSHIVAFTGAGISTPSGIPDFRSPDSGLWDKVDPLMVASIFGFRQNPQGFYDWIHPLAKLTYEAQPNPAHQGLYELEKIGKLKTIITQNIDMLHSKAGNSDVYELHGHMRTATCISCFTKYELDPFVGEFIETGKMASCEKCGGVIKPDVILFGEQLPYRALQGAKDAARACDLMIVIGSSLEVAPASDIPKLAHRTGAKIAVINFEPTMIDDIASIVIHDDVAKVMPAVMKHLDQLN